jgi:hypothetical protein
MTLRVGQHEPLDSASRAADAAVQGDRVAAAVAESHVPDFTLLEFMNLFEEFRGPSWDGWRTHLARIVTGVREFYAAVGRGAGKSRIVAVIAAWFATRPYRRSPGEHIFIGVFAPDRKQAGVTFRYVVGLLKSVPELAALIVNESKESVELSNGVILEVITASVAAPRGRAYALAIVEEAAFLPTEHSANPDVELLRALRPALARVPGSLLAVVSSPYARKGVLWTAWQKYFGAPDAEVVFVQAPTLELNPTFDRRAIDAAYADDPTSAAAEYGAQFRSDVEGLFQHDAVTECVINGRRELPRCESVAYVGFVDPSGGSADSFTVAVAHADGGRVILDALREIRAPFSPDAVVKEFADLLKSYGIAEVGGDRYAGEWPREAFRKHGIQYAPCEMTRSELYLALLPLINSERVELLDDERLVNQLTGLERRTSRGGRDSVDHAPGSHDDRANACAGALVGAEKLLSDAGPQIRCLGDEDDEPTWHRAPLSGMRVEDYRW